MLFRALKFALCMASSLVVLTIGQMSAAARDNYAILIGAATYPNLDERLWLVGPTNDVDLVREFLLGNETVPFEDANITVLADGIDGATAPTLEAIRRAVADLTNRVQHGDFVYLHFSGHGSQMPARDPSTELDGLDEIFLPVDAGPWNDAKGTVPNALVDDEIGKMIQGLRDRGASVWAVFDACHSGTVTRAAVTDDEVRLRRLPPSTLGVPEDLLDGVKTRTVSDPRAKPEAPFDTTGGSGTFVAFFAAQTNETTPEKRLPRGKPNRRSQGVFTFTLFETLAANPGITHRQLGQEILRRYSVENLARSTPLFEGDLDTPVFAVGGVDPIRQWPFHADEGLLKIGAGTLHGLDTGIVMAIVGAPTDQTSEAIGFATVTESSAMTAWLAPVAHDSTPTVAMDEIPKGAYLRKTDQAISFGLSVALPEVGSKTAAALAPVMPFIKDLLAEARISLVPATEPADLRLAGPQDGGAGSVLIVQDSGLIDANDPSGTPSVPIAGRDAEEIAADIADVLTKVARVQNLMRLGQGYSAKGLNIDLTLRMRSPDNRSLRDLRSLPVPRLIPDDEVHILARNNEDVPLDLNVLYIARDHSITHMYKGRLQPGDVLKKGLLRVTDTDFGRDRLLLVLTPAQPQLAVEDLSFLAQDELSVTRMATGSFRGLLREAGFGTLTRAAVALEDDASGPRPAIIQMLIDTVPGKMQ